MLNFTHYARPYFWGTVSYYSFPDPQEMGLNGIAFHPEFTDRDEPGYGKFYTAYSASSNSGVADYHEDHARTHKTTIREWTATDPEANEFKGTSRVVLRVGQFSHTHNVGRIAFNPTAVGSRDPNDETFYMRIFSKVRSFFFGRKSRFEDGESKSPDYGMLYIALADGGFPYDPHKRSQSLLSPMGGILRIDPLGGDGERAYGIPDDNPFVGRDDALPEIFTYGSRNPQHLSWDQDGRLFFIDIGQAMVEEVNLGVAGANYGWPLREGNFATGLAYEGGLMGPVYPLPECDVYGFTYPIAQYDHDDGGAVGGGYVYRGKAIPDLQGVNMYLRIWHMGGCSTSMQTIWNRVGCRQFTNYALIMTDRAARYSKSPGCWKAGTAGLTCALPEMLRANFICLPRVMEWCDDWLRWTSNKGTIS